MQKEKEMKIIHSIHYSTKRIAKSNSASPHLWNPDQNLYSNLVQRLMIKLIHELHNLQLTSAVAIELQQMDYEK